MKMRVTRRNQRRCSASHLDRTAGHTEQGKRHIDPDRTSLNRYRSCYPEEQLTLKEAEKKYYREHYSDMVEAKRQRNIKNRHADRNRNLSVEALYNSERYGPIETIYQVGKQGQTVSADTLEAVFDSYNQKIQEVTKGHYHILSYAMHLDEATPHIHIRGVWDYRDKDGVLCIGQAQALRELGIERPDPERKADRHNNAMMTIDRISRELFLEACQEHDLEVIVEPLRGARHEETREYVLKEQMKKYKDVKEQLTRDMNQAAAVQEKLSALEAAAAAAEERLEAAEKAIAALPEGVWEFIRDMDKESKRSRKKARTDRDEKIR